MIDTAHDGAQAVVADARFDDARTDADAILQAYRRWGVSCAEHLAGDCTFVISDRAEQRLFFARDPAGVRPLYYAVEGSQIRWAFDVDSLLSSGLPRRPEESMIADYLLGDFRDPEATFFHGIRQVRPGHALWHERGQWRSSRYWRPESLAFRPAASEPEELERLRELIRNAVGCRLDSPSPVGLMLSGGIDSTSVAAVALAAREQDPDLPRLAALTVAYDDVLRDEREAIQLLKSRWDLAVHDIVPVTGDGPPAQFDWFISHTATPYYHGFHTHPRVFQAAARAGCRALLTGIGGDEVFGIGLAEDAMLTDLLRTGHVGQFHREVTRLAWALRCSERAVLMRVLRAQIPIRARRTAKAALGRQVPAWIEPGFAAQQRLAARGPARAATVFPTRCQQRSFEALTNPAWTLALNQLHEASSAFGIECRHPFLDRRLIEHVLAMPLDMKRKCGQRKGLLQQALAAWIPVRPRYGEDSAGPDAGSPQSRALEVRRLREAFGPPEAPLFRYVETRELARLMRRYAEGDSGARSVLWKCASLARWLRSLR